MREKLEINCQTGEITERELKTEEIAEMEAMQQPQVSYDQLVADLIRERYTVDQEIAINRQRDTKPEEFQAYFDYCEQCKQKANESII